jgi:hypothetical protein
MLSGRRVYVVIRGPLWREGLKWRRAETARGNKGGKRMRIGKRDEVEEVPQPGNLHTLENF